MNLTELTQYPEDKVRALVGLTPQALGALLLTALPEIEQRRQPEYRVENAIGAENIADASRANLLFQRAGSYAIGESDLISAAADA